ncbi:hypothetical protein H6775_00515 [Candidatus Nomurabacteria bacterium]|nr:hypothetical protein [Candidatus Nomurabacteria bacterium]
MSTRPSFIQKVHDILAHFGLHQKGNRGAVANQHWPDEVHTLFFGENVHVYLCWKLSSSFPEEGIDKCFVRVYRRGKDVTDFDTDNLWQFNLNTRGINCPPAHGFLINGDQASLEALKLMQALVEGLSSEST